MNKSKPTAHWKRWVAQHWMLTVRLTVGFVGFAALTLSVLVAVWAWDNPWPLLAIAVVCAIVVFPQAIARVVKAIKLGDLAFELRELAVAETDPHAPGVEELAHKLEEPRRHNREEARLLLSQLRTAGVEIRNRGRALAQMEVVDVPSWCAEVTTWTKAVTSAIERLSQADAEWFRTLDVVPVPRLKMEPINAEHAKAYRELDFRLVKLGELLARYVREEGRQRPNR